MGDVDVFVNALRSKIEDLEEEKATIDAKIDLLNELIVGETVKPVKKKAGRPKGAKGKTKPSFKKVSAEDEELFNESLKQLGGEGTTPEMQKKITGRFNPQPRPHTSLGPGIRAGTKKQVLGGEEPSIADSRLSIGDE